MALLIIKLIFVCLTEIWQQHNDFVLLNQTTPTSFVYLQKPCGLAIIPKPDSMNIPAQNVISFEYVAFQLASAEPLQAAISPSTLLLWDLIIHTFKKGHSWSAPLTLPPPTYRVWTISDFHIFLSISVDPLRPHEKPPITYRNSKKQTLSSPGGQG